MGLNLSDLFSSAKSAVEQTANDAMKLGYHSGLGYLEDQAIRIISADKAQHDANFKKATTEILNRPTAVGSFGGYISDLAQSPVLKQYGPYVIIGILLVGGAFVLMGRK